MARRGFPPKSPDSSRDRDRPSDGRTFVPFRRRRRGGARLDNLTAQAHEGREGLERQADAVAERIRKGDRVRLGKGRSTASTLTPPQGGRPLHPEARELAERGLGLDAEAIRVHDDRDARLAAGMLGARAFADGSDIWLGPGEREYDRDLMAHELAHVAQGVPGLHLRSATWLERRAWLAFFDHYLPRKFLDNYMDDTGAPITLMLWDMINVNPIVNIRRSPGFATELAALQAQARAHNAAGTPAPAIKYIEVSGPGQALTNGTLGNFTIHYKGVLSVNPDGTWTFVGSMEFYDVWDFDPKPFGTSGRSTAGELKTRVASTFLPGKPFEIFSVPAPCVQSGSDKRAVWPGGTPQHVGDQAGRAGADVEVGGAGGEVGGETLAGPPGAEVGGAGGVEVGAQSAEDLNP